jgi:HK97 family phage major capsid protein
LIINNLKNNKMPTILELKDQKANLLLDNQRLFDLADKEERLLTDIEKMTIQRNTEKAEQYDLKIKSEARKAEPLDTSVNILIRQGKPKSEFSLIKTINRHLNHKAPTDETRAIMDEAVKEFVKGQVSYTGDILIPVETRTDITAGTADHGAEIVEEIKKTILPPLTDKLILTQAGATFLTGLVGNVSIPSYAGTTATWYTEVAPVTESAGALSEVNFSPKRLSAVVDVSKLFLAQDSIGAERLLLDNIATAVALKLESTILGKSPGVATTQPYGMGFGITTGAGAAVAVPTYASVVAMETAVDVTNALAGNLKYITNSYGRGILKNIMQGPSGVGRYLLEDGNMNGYPVLVTNSASHTCGLGSSGNLLVFGNWADLCITQWGGYDITVDPYTVAFEGQVRIVINAYFDAKGLRGTVVSGSGFDDYQISFAKAAII